MIVSHRHRFIFIKTQKVAGTSVEIALSKFLGPDDVVTPILDPADEALRRRLGVCGPQNYKATGRELLREGMSLSAQGRNFAKEIIRGKWPNDITITSAPERSGRLSVKKSGRSISSYDREKSFRQGGIGLLLLWAPPGSGSSVSRVRALR